MVSGKLPVRYACASASSRVAAPAAAAACQNSSTISRRASPVDLGPRVGVGDDVAGLLERVDVGRRAVGQAALGAQHAVQPVAAFAAEDLDREIQRQVVLVLARQADVADADLGLHRARPVDDDDAPRRRRRLDRLGAARFGAPPVPNARSAPAKASSGVTSPTIARMALLAPNQALWNARRSSRVMLAIDSGVPESGGRTGGSRRPGGRTPCRRCSRGPRS